MQTVLITGANGFVGHHLTRELLNHDFLVVATGKGSSRLPFVHQNLIYEALDFTDEEQVEALMQKHKPVAVVHSGALSKPDECAENKAAAYRVNVEGTKHLLGAAAYLQSFFIFLSSDFIFEGSRETYSEEDEGNPVNYYGHTKLEAEKAVKSYPLAWSIVRPVLVYGPAVGGRNNLVTMVAEALQNGRSLKIFNDQTRTPTYVNDLVWVLLQVLRTKTTGILHVAGPDLLTPYQIAVQVAEQLQLDAGMIEPVTETNFKQPARRPARTVFHCNKVKALFGYQPTPFADGLKKTLESSTEEG